MAEETKDTSVVEVEKEQVDTQEETATTEKTFTQAELDAIIQKEKAKAKRSAEREYKEKMDEADKLRKMNADQKAAYEAQKQADRIALVTRIRLLLIADGAYYGKIILPHTKSISEYLFSENYDRIEQIG